MLEYSGSPSAYAPTPTTGRYDLLAGMLIERYGATPARRESGRSKATPPDAVTVVAERQRILCQALDGRHIAAVDAAA